MFSQNLTLQEAFQSAAQMNEELKGTEFDGALFCKKVEAYSFRAPSSVSLIMAFARIGEQLIIHYISFTGNRLSRIIHLESRFVFQNPFWFLVQNSLVNWKSFHPVHTFFRYSQEAD